MYLNLQIIKYNNIQYNFKIKLGWTRKVNDEKELPRNIIVHKQEA